MSWRDVIYTVDERSDPPIRSVVDAICRTHVNGGMICRCLRPLNGPAYDQVHSHKIEDLKSFLESESVRQLLPELQIPEVIDPFPQFSIYGRFEFEGALIALLLSDGAYAKPELTEDHAREMARNFVEQLLPDRRNYATIFRIEDAWSEWFYDIAWDASFIVRDPTKQCWWIICVTDTD